jgi:hypothetical protein
VINNYDIPNLSHFTQDFCSGFFNVQENLRLLLSYAGEFKNIERKKWLGTVLFKRSILSELKLIELRHPIQKSRSRRIPNAGWHFSNCNGHFLDFQKRFHQKMNSVPIGSSNN